MSILVLGIIFCVFLMRIADRNSDRTRMALGWLVLAICGNVVFAAYEPLEFKTKLGLFNATFSWVCISFSFVECLLSRNKFTISRQAIQFQFFQVLYSALFILSAITNGGGFLYSHLFISATALILIYLAPISRDLVSIEWIGVACTTFIWFTLLSGYNPPEIDQRTGLPIAGTDAQSYRNVTWEIFNLDNRFHGPFTHPNQLGIFCAFFATILLTSNKRLFNFFGILNILLLFCAVSRTSIFSCLIGTSLYYLNNRMKLETRKIFYVTLTFFFIFYFIFISKISGTGRREKFITALKQYNFSFLYGPSTDYIENTFISSLYAAGLIGLLLCIYFHFKALVNFWNVEGKFASLVVAMSGQLFFASFGEETISGTSFDSGTLYLLFFTLALNTVPKYRKKNENLK